MEPFLVIPTFQISQIPQIRPPLPRWLPNPPLLSLHLPLYLNQKLRHHLRHRRQRHPQRGLLRRQHQTRPLSHPRSSSLRKTKRMTNSRSTTSIEERRSDKKNDSIRPHPRFSTQSSLTLLAFHFSLHGLSFAYSFRLFIPHGISTSLTLIASQRLTAWQTVKPAIFSPDPLPPLIIFLADLLCSKHRSNQL